MRRVYGMIEAATLPSDLVGQHIERWGIGDLGKRPEKKSPRLPAHEGREYHGQIYE